MSEAMLVAVINLITKVGIDAAIVIIENLQGVTTPVEALEALKRARDKTAQDYANEAEAAKKAFTSSSLTPPA